MNDRRDHTLEFLLAFNGRSHWYEQGYCARFKIERVQPSSSRAHGLVYSLTLHDPDGKRIMGFDNAHAVAAPGRRSKRSTATDHWHRTGDDPGRPYPFRDAAVLIGDFFDEVERVLNERAVPLNVVRETVNNEKE